MLLWRYWRVRQNSQPRISHKARASRPTWSAQSTTSRGHALYQPTPRGISEHSRTIFQIYRIDLARIFAPDAPDMAQDVFKSGRPFVADASPAYHASAIGTSRTRSSFLTNELFLHSKPATQPSTVFDDHHGPEHTPRNSQANAPDKGTVASLGKYHGFGVQENGGVHASSYARFRPWIRPWIRARMGSRVWWLRRSRRSQRARPSRRSCRAWQRRYDGDWRTPRRRTS